MLEETVFLSQKILAVIIILGRTDSDEIFLTSIPTLAAGSFGHRDRNEYHNTKIRQPQFFFTFLPEQVNFSS